MNKIIYVGKHLLTFTVSRHAHSSWELVYCTNGSGYFVFDGGSVKYEEGDIVAIPPNVAHTNVSESGFTNIHVNMTGLTLPPKNIIVVHDDTNKFLLNAFQAAFYHFSSTSAQRSAILAAYGDLISSYIIAYQKDPLRSGVVDDIESCIINNYPDSNFELDEYLRSLPFSYDYLRKLFKKEIGVTPHKYLSDKRLEAAAESLCSASVCGISITEVAYQCGFREPLYFSRMFKKKYGLSPTQYQKQTVKDTVSSAPDLDSTRIELDA